MPPKQLINDNLTRAKLALYKALLEEDPRLINSADEELVHMLLQDGYVQLYLDEIKSRHAIFSKIERKNK